MSTVIFPEPERLIYISEGQSPEARCFNRYYKWFMSFTKQEFHLSGKLNKVNARLKNEATCTEFVSEITYNPNGVTYITQGRSPWIRLPPIAPIEPEKRNDSLMAQYFHV